MKQVPKTEEIGGDRGIDRLLRLESRQKPAPGAGCAEFDPDFASAYAERALTAPENKRYETHLALCAPCRRAVTVLIRTAEPISSVPDRKPGREIVATGLASESWLRRLAGALMTPQWGLAAAAVLVLAIALPLVFSSRNTRMDRSAAPGAEALESAQQPAPGAEKAEATVAAAQTEAAHANAQGSAGNISAGLVSRVERVPAEPPGAPTGAAGPPAPAPGVLDDRSASDKTQGADQGGAKREEARQNEASARDALAAARPSDAPAKDDAAKKVSQAEPSAQPQAPALESQARARQSELAKIDERQAQRMPQQDQDSARVQVLKQGRADAGEREQKEAKIRPEDAVPPPPPPSSSPDRRAARRSLAQPPRMAMTESSGPGAAGAKSTGPPPRRETKGKTFWFRDDVWTDKDYNPIKELPVITLVRDSDVYREVLNKRGGLKPYFQMFSGNDRAIVVYKGTVYKIIPQDAAR